MTKFIALLAGAASVAAAQAQSSVTLAGVADASLRQISNEARPTDRSVQSGGNSTSKLIVRGVEDMGNGLSAAFHLEAGFLLDTGASVRATQFWDRRATVALASKTLGEVRWGRDVVPSYANWSVFDPFSYVGVAGSTTLVSSTPPGPIRAAFGLTGTTANPNTVVRANSAVQYLLPGKLGGVEGGVMASAATAGGTAASGDNSVRGLRLGYKLGGFFVSAARTTTENEVTTAGKFTDQAIGASYDFGVLKISAVRRSFEYSTAEQTDTMVGLTVPAGPGSIRAVWHRSAYDGRVGATNISANGATHIGLGYVYDFSKRTAAYATWARIANKGGIALAVPGAASGMAAGGTSRGFEVGLRHNF
jgi:predicted porin